MAFFFGFHLFGANFASDEEAELYACAQWEPVPPTTTSDAEYCAWEDRNPTWRMADELEFHIDSDFVELPVGLKNVISQIRYPAERAEVRARMDMAGNAVSFANSPIMGDGHA